MDKKNKKINDTITGIVTTVENYGLFLQLDSGEKVFLPKENMHISKKKKFKDIFSIGFVIKGRITSIKKDYYVISQKEEGNKKDVSNFVDKQEKKKLKKKSQSKKEIKNIEQVKREDLKLTKQEEKNDTTLKDLKKLKFIGNMKISRIKNKKKDDEKEQQAEIKFLEVPQGLLENIEMTTESAVEKFSKLTKKLKEQGYLHE